MIFQQRFVLVSALALTDTNAHDPTTDSSIIVADISTFTNGFIKITNTHGQAIQVQFRSNIGVLSTAIATAATTNPDNLGPVVILASASVAAPTTQSRTIQVWDGSMPPLIYAVITALVAPASGSITITMDCWDRKGGN